MKKSKYWQQRFKLVEEASHKEAIKTYKEIEPAFIKAQREINTQIQVWYGRFAKNNEMTLADVRKALNANELKEFRWDVEDFIKYGKENAINQKWMKELENASVKFHITRLESLLLRNQQTMEVLFGNEIDQVDQMARRIISEGYYKSIYEVQKGFGLGFDISGIDDKELNLLVSKPWAGDGKNFSARIWQRKGQMVNDLQKKLTRNLILGKAPDESIKNLERFVDKKIKNTRNAAGRLVMTESAYFHSLSQKKAFDELDVEEYEIVATLDSRTSEICQDMDGKHFPMEDYQAGITAPPFHVYCRSTTVPYFDDEFTLGEERAARDKDGKTFYVPGEITYEEWFAALDKPYYEISKSVIYRLKSKNKKLSELNEVIVNGEILKVDGKKVILDHNKHELDYAKWIVNELGGDLGLHPRVVLPKNINTPDYIWNEEKWDLKTINNHGNSTLSNAIKKAKKQTNNVILDIQIDSYTDEILNNELLRIFNNKRLGFIDKIMITRKGEFIGIFKKKK